MANTTNFGWETPDDTDLVKDGAAAIRTLGSSIDTSLVDLKGGTTGQVLAKNSNTDMDFIWTAGGDITEVQAGTGISVASGTGPIPVITNTVATAIDAKGDLVAGTGADTFGRIAVGANNTVLTADSSTATGLKWAAPAAGGKVLQVVSAVTTTPSTTTSTTLADTGLTATITPTLATSKILVLVSQVILISRSSDSTGAAVSLFRDATNIYNTGGTDAYSTMYVRSVGSNTVTEHATVTPIAYLDSPATTSATTYKTQHRVFQATSSGTSIAQNNNAASSIILLEIGA